MHRLTLHEIPIPQKTCSSSSDSKGLNLTFSEAPLGLHPSSAASGEDAQRVLPHAAEPAPSPFRD
ncbi:hypothetical protein EYF80_003528 [Liparis tanakae]|uniref:Uncharacterized protein n=1 Tax=Liparis tanakae TaxID=230148 RepID=A0A4Z2J881_9TELE|nr:hypothetical protein EYF80_003528 [Liparis tanakae]